MIKPITLRNYLSNSHPIKQDAVDRVHSCLTTALRETRMITLRSVNTGKVLERVNRKCKENKCTIGYPGHLLGAVGYLLILDQIGSCFHLNSIPRSTSRTAIIRALEYFAPHLSEEERYAFYALRCSLAHDFNLININKSDNSRTRQLMSHKFDLGHESHYPLIKLPTPRWNMIMGVGDNNQRTIINVKLMGDMVEDIVKNLRREEKSGNLKIVFSDGIDEIRKRYLIWTKQ